LVAGAGATHPVAGTQPDQQTIEDMLASLRERLASDPDSAEGWLLLGRSYMALARYEEAVPAFARAFALLGETAPVMLQYADALAMAAGGRIGAEVRELVARILVIEPDNVAALWLAGLGAAEAGENPQALEYLRRARTAAARQGASTAELDAILDGLTAGRTPSGDAVAAASVRVAVAIAPELAEKISPEDAVFIFARAPGDNGPPLAVTRAHAHGLPLELVLDDTMAMAPMHKMTVGDTVIITARVSKSGAAAPASGDLQGSSAAFVVGELDAVAVRIDQIVE
jgi:cytochrome c-type biogenesis protein CcmH